MLRMPSVETEIFLISCSFFRLICMLAPLQELAPPPTGNPVSAPGKSQKFSNGGFALDSACNTLRAA